MRTYTEWCNSLRTIHRKFKKWNRRYEKGGTIWHSKAKCNKMVEYYKDEYMKIRFAEDRYK